MRTKILFLSLLLVLVGSLACWDQDKGDGWDDSHPRYYTLKVGIGESCHHGPYAVYLDGKEDDDKIGEIRGPDNALTVILERGWYQIYVEDSDGHEVYDEHFKLDDDDTIRVHC